jgi:hypothetical protein
MGYTTRLERYIYQRSRREPISQVAQDEGLGKEAVQAIFEDWAKNDRGTRLPTCESDLF